MTDALRRDTTAAGPCHAATTPRSSRSALLRGASGRSVAMPGTCRRRLRGWWPLLVALATPVVVSPTLAHTSTRSAPSSCATRPPSPPAVGGSPTLALPPPSPSATRPPSPPAGGGSPTLALPPPSPLLPPPMSEVSPVLALAALVGYVNFMNPRATSWSKSPRYHVVVCVPSMRTNRSASSSTNVVQCLYT